MSAPRLRRALPLTVVPLLAAAALPAPVAALTPAPPAPAVELKLAQPRPDPRLRELRLTARCARACTIRLVKLNVMPYRTRGGAPVQLPHAAEGPLKGTRKVPAGGSATIRLPVPSAVERFAAATLPAGNALVGNVVVAVEQDGTSSEAVRMFAATGPGTPAPFPAASTLDAIRVPAQPPGRTTRKARYKVSVTGTQTSTWSYDRTRQQGACTVIARGSGRQTLRLRSTATPALDAVTFPDGSPGLLKAGTKLPVLVPVQIDAVRDGSETQGATGDCGGVFGGDGRGGPPQCTRSGSTKANVLVGYLDLDNRLGGFVTPSSFPEPTPEPDCPVELPNGAVDPLDFVQPRFVRTGPLTAGGAPGKVIVVHKLSDVRRLDGGTVSTTGRITVTFRKVN